MLLGGVSEQSPPLLPGDALLLGDVDTVADRLSPLAVLVLPPFAEAVTCIQPKASELCGGQTDELDDGWISSSFVSLASQHFPCQTCKPCGLLVA